MFNPRLAPASAPDDGAPLRDKGYTWTADVYLAMAAHFL
jgi:hypothetical protein